MESKLLDELLSFWLLKLDTSKFGILRGLVISSTVYWSLAWLRIGILKTVCSLGAGGYDSPRSIDSICLGWIEASFSGSRLNCIFKVYFLD